MHTTGIRGFVTDENGNPIEGVKIVVGDRTKKIETFKDGDFWRLLVPGKYIIKARKRGYNKVKRIVRVMNGTSTLINFTMVAKNDSKKPIKLDSVVDKSESKVAVYESENEATKLKLSVDSQGRGNSAQFAVCVLCLLIWSAWPF